MSGDPDVITDVDEASVETAAAQRVDVLRFQLPNCFRAIGVFGAKRQLDMRISLGDVQDFSL